jgi:hypothetical protein
MEDAFAGKNVWKPKCQQLRSILITRFCHLPTFFHKEFDSAETTQVSFLQFLVNLLTTFLTERCGTYCSILIMLQHGKCSTTFIFLKQKFYATFHTLKNGYNVLQLPFCNKCSGLNPVSSMHSRLQASSIVSTPSTFPPNQIRSQIPFYITRSIQLSCAKSSFF